MEYSITIKKKLKQNRIDNDVIYVKQYENKYTIIQFDELTIESNYQYFAVYKKMGEEVVYELPIESNQLVIGNWLTNNDGVYRLCIVAKNEEEKVVICDWFKIVVEPNIYNNKPEEVVFPQPIQSKYEQLIELVEEIEGKLERGEFKGETGNGIAYCTFSNYKLTLRFTDGTEYTTTSLRGAKGEKGEDGLKGDKGDKGADGKDYVITESDYNAIANVSVGKLQPQITELSNVKADKTDIPTKTSELVNDSTFTTKAYVDEEIAKGGKVQDVQVNGASIVSGGVANVPIATSSKVGLVKINTSASSGIFLGTDGNVQIDSANDTLIANRTNTSRPINPSHLDFAVKSALCDGKGASYTEQEKASARDRLGVVDYSDDIALLKWKTLNLATEVVDSQEAYSKSVPNNVYEKALLNKLGGKSVVMNQYVSNSKYSATGSGVGIVMENGVVRFSGTSTATGELTLWTNRYPATKDHYYYYWVKDSSIVSIQTNVNGGYYNYTKDIVIITRETSNASIIPTIRAIYNPSAGTTFNEVAHLYVVDLTQMFGIGNEPTSVDDIRIKLLDKYLEANPSYNEGSLVSADVESVVSRGVNLWNPALNSHDFYRYIDGFIATSPKYLTLGLDNFIDLKQGETLTLSFTTTDTNPWLAFVVFDANGNYSTNKSAYSSTISFTASTNCKVSPQIYSSNYAEAIYGVNVFDIMLEKGTTPTEYAPYWEQAKPLSTIIQKYFPQGMHSAGSVFDEIDIDRGVAIKRIGEVDLGSLEWGYATANNFFIATFTLVKLGNDLIKSNALCSRYDTFSYRDLLSKNSGFAVGDNGRLYFRETTLTDSNLFKEKVNGVLMYYELATPTETPLDQADWEYLQALQVEANGTITFENAEMLSVPNEESYLKRV